jgi:hypothetical protein
MKNSYPDGLFYLDDQWQSHIICPDCVNDVPADGELFVIEGESVCVSCDRKYIGRDLSGRGVWR